MADDITTTAQLPTDNQPPITPVEPGSDADDGFLAQVRKLNEEKTGDQDDDRIVQPREDGSRPSDGKSVEPPSSDEDLEESGEEEEEEGEEEEITVDPLAAAEKAKPKKTKAENMKNLRNALKLERESKAELQTQIQTLQSQIENVTETEAVKTILSQKDARIKELEKYEDLLGLYKTEGFKEAYYDSIENLKKEAGRVATDYGVDESVINEALKIGNRKQLNEYLAQHFDPLGINDIRKYIVDAQELAIERTKVEANPKKAREELVAIMNNSRAEGVRVTREKLQRSMKSAWDSMLTVYTDKDGGLDPIKDVVGDAEHEATKNAILKRADVEYGKAMGVLVDSGLRDMPESVVKALAARFQLSEVAGHVVVQNRALKEENEALQKQLGKVNGYTRPLSSGKGKGKGPNNSAPKIEGDDIAGHVMGRAMAATSN